MAGNIDYRSSWRCDGLVIAGILVFMLTNALMHDSRVGYDVSAHKEYALTLAGWRVPMAAETTEFLSPPLAYEAAMLAAAGSDVLR